MLKKIYYLILIAILLPLSGCLQTPQEYEAASGEETCINLSDTFTVRTQQQLTVNDQGTGVVSWVVQRVQVVMLASAKEIYTAMAVDGQWRDIVTTLVALAIAFYALSIMMGLAQPSPYVFIVTALKIIVVWFMVTDWNLFYDLVIQNLEAIISGLSQTMANAFSAGIRMPNIYEAPIDSSQNIFLYVDKIISMIFSTNFWRVIFATITSGWAGLTYTALLLLMAGSYFFAVLRSVQLFLVAFIARCLLYAMAPFFIVFLLFRQTKSLFDGWMEQLINFSLQPVFIMAFVGMFNMIWLGFMSAIIPEHHANQQICYGVVAEMSGGAEAIYGQTTGNNTQGAEAVSSQAAELPFNLWVILVLILLTRILSSMLSWSVNVAARISGGYLTLEAAPEGWSELKQKALGGAGGTLGGFFGGGSNHSSSRDYGVATRGAAPTSAPPTR